MLAILRRYALAVLLFIAVITAFVSYVASQQMADFNRQQAALAKVTSHHARDVVELTLANQRKSIAHFTSLHAQLIRNLATAVDDAGVYDELELLLGTYFPAMHTFTLADSRGNVLLDGSVEEPGDACLKNIKMYAVDSSKVDASLRLHIDENGSHYDILGKLFVQNGQFIILFVSLRPDEIVRMLASVETDGHALYIVDDETALIEMSSQAARPLLSRSEILSRQESDRIRARAHIDNTRWDVVDVVDGRLLAAAYTEIFSRAATMLLIFAVAGVMVLLRIARSEKQRQLSEQKLKEHEAELEQTVRERTAALTKANERLQHLSLSDGLTGIANRRHFDTILNREIGRAHRENKPLSLLLFDIDFFKNYNDSAGHLAGDDCLRKIARAVETEFKRGGDLTARYGGEEFAIILPGVDVDEMQKQAERVREVIWNLNIPHPNSSVANRVTVSVGGSTLRRDQYKTGNDLIDEADEALYRAKSGGRNTFRVYAS